MPNNTQDQKNTPILSPLNPIPLDILQNIPKKKIGYPKECRKKKGHYSKKTLKAIDLCATTNIEPAVALTLVNNGRTPAPATVKNVKNGVERYFLTHPRMVKLARNVVLDTLKGECREIDQRKFNSKTGEVVEFKEVIAPTITNQLAAAQMVYDRAEPTVHQAINVNLNADVRPVDLGKWLNKG